MFFKISSLFVATCYYTSKMACPYFYPVERDRTNMRSESALLPLGDAWAGLCRAGAGPAWQPDQAVLDPLCMLGYARSLCHRFPHDDPGADAVRFAISRDDGVSLQLYYVLERDHHPFAHGPLEYSLTARRFLQTPSGEILSRQAEAYVQSYLRRKTA
jgi:hypothetical protein